MPEHPKSRCIRPAAAEPPQDDKFEKLKADIKKMLADTGNEEPAFCEPYGQIARLAGHMLATQVHGQYGKLQ